MPEQKSLIIRWEDPPGWIDPDHPENYIRQELQAHPGSWGVVAETDKKNATHAVYGPLQQLLKAEGMECTVRKIGRRIVCYARWPKAKTNGAATK